jgi:hypothetical protein
VPSVLGELLHSDVDLDKNAIVNLSNDAVHVGLPMALDLSSEIILSVHRSDPNLFPVEESFVWEFRKIKIGDQK